MDPIRLVLSDYDRTFTDETLRIAPGLASAIRRLQAKGVMFSLISGRKYSFMMELYRRMDGLLDSFVAENGCLGFARGQRHAIAGEDGDREALLYALTERGVPYDAGDIVVSVHRKHDAAVDEIMRGFPCLHVTRNVDSLMILPPGASKAEGIRWLTRLYGLSPANVACIGDAENDMDMRGGCRLMGAVGNALPAVKVESDYICRQQFGAGLREFLEYIEAGCQ